jgi:hypothetical protein
MLRVEVYARALCASQNAKRSKVGAAKLFFLEGGRGQKNWCSTILLWLSVDFGQVLRTRIPGRKRQPSDDARTASIIPGSRSKSSVWYVLAARGLVAKHVYGVEMRVVAAKVLTVAQHLLKIGVHLTTALARLQLHNVARRSNLEVGCTREKRARRSGNI